MDKGSSSNGGNGTQQGVYYLFGKPIPLHEFVPLQIPHNEQPAPPATERGGIALQEGTGTARRNYYLGESSMQRAGTNMEMGSNLNLISSGTVIANYSASVEAQDASMDDVDHGVVERARGREDMNSNIDLNNPATDDEDEENGRITSGVVANGAAENDAAENDAVMNSAIENQLVANNAIQNSVVANAIVENDTVTIVYGLAANAAVENGAIENGTVENGAIESNSDSGASAHMELETGSPDMESDAAME